VRFGRFGRKLALAMLPVMMLGVLPPVVHGAFMPGVTVTVTPPAPTEGQSVVISAAIADPDSNHWIC